MDNLMLVVQLADVATGSSHPRGKTRAFSRSVDKLYT